MTMTTAAIPAMAERIEIWPVERLIPYAANARTHSDEQINKVAASMLEFGFTATLPLPATALVSVTWLGAQLGGLTLQSDGMTVKSGSRGVAVARVTFNTAPVARGIVSPSYLAGGILDFSINAVIKATAA